MSKFTQGEWKYLDELYQVCAYTNSEDPDLLADITGEIGCKGFFNEEEVNANGRLIASAPKMYWLLTEMLKISALKAQASTEKNDPLFMKALVAQDGAENIAKKLLAYIDGTEAQP